tara:strand:- start:103 stop:1455 length:1353 start_codon:yes stop_codon:yes gene_type:complete
MATKNIVPNDNGEGGIGTSSKYWATGYIDAITTTGNLVVGGNTGIGDSSPSQKLVVEGDWNQTATNNNQVYIQGSTNSNMQLRLGYDTTGDHGYIQAILNGTGGRELHLNTSGGAVVIADSGTIGCASDADLLTLANQSLTVAGDIAVSGGDITLGNAANASVNPLQSASTVAGKALTLAGGSAGAGTNLNAGGLFLLSGNSTGNGTGVIEFYTAPAGSSGTGSNSSVKRLTIGSDGAATFEGNTSANIVTARDNMFVEAGQFYIGADNGSTDDTFRQSVGSGAFKIESRESGTWTERFKIDTVGDVSVNNNLFIGSTKAIYIGGTAAANALDDYEEGTWTPAISTTSGSVTVDSSAGQYTKIGRQIIMHFQFTLSSSSGGSGTLKITNLPITVNANSGAVVGAGRILDTANTISVGHYTSTNQISIHLYNGNYGGTDYFTTGFVTYYTA